MMVRNIVKRYLIDEIEPGMELARSLVGRTNLYALNEGTVLTSSLIERLKKWGVEYVDIRIAAEVEKQESTSLSPKEQALSDDYNDAVYSLKKVFKTAKFARQVSLPEIRQVAEMYIEQFIDTIGILNYLHVLERQDDYNYHHAIDVAVVSGMIGRWLGFDGSELEELIMAGLLHDIGKTQITNEIIGKAGFLSELEMDKIKLHTTRGFKLIKDLDLSHNVKYAVLQHHERMDGSGYPLKVTGEKIHVFARIIAIADVYDAMTSDKAYRQKTTPFHAVDTIAHDMYDKLDPNICAVFLNNMRDYFVGNTVELNDGRTAEVVYLGRTLMARPIVRTEDGNFIDLENKKGINIVKLLKT